MLFLVAVFINYPNITNINLIAITIPFQISIKFLYNLIMSETESIPLPQEIIGASNIADIERLLKYIRDGYKECLTPILVDRKEVDLRVIQFEKQLHDLNKKRAEFYGRCYNPPEIFYVDRVQGTQRSTEINGAINKRGLGKFGCFDEYAGKYQTIGNYIIIFVNNFDDKDVDSWDVCRKIRHELNHAGSVLKHRVYRDENEKLLYQGYRVGAQLDSKTRNNVLLGLAIDEGHHAIEDEIFEGLHTELLEQDEYLKHLPNGEQLFPGAKQKYEKLRQQAIQRGEIEADQMLVSYRENRENNEITLIVVANSSEYYSELMRLIYQWNPELFRFACDFIYGDKMTVFAKAVNSTFGEGFFSKLMAAKNEDDTVKLVDELKQLLG